MINRTELTGVIMGAFLMLVPFEADAQLKINFATREQAQEIITEEDSYTKGWGQFDLDSRAGHPGATLQEVMDNQREQCREYSPEEQDAIRKAFAELEALAVKEGYKLPMPEEITMVCTTMHEEGDAGGYTRGTCIFLQQGLASHPMVKRILAHELFHVLTRNSHDFKKNMYSTIGFEVMDQDIEFGQDIRDIRISNPDVSNYDSYAELTVAGKKCPCTMMIYADKSYEGGSFFNYLRIGLIPLDEQHRPIVKDGKTIMYPIKECSDFYDKVGNNTGYVINPEECLADNFAMVMLEFKAEEVKTPELLDSIRKVLKGK